MKNPSLVSKKDFQWKDSDTNPATDIDLLFALPMSCAGVKMELKMERVSNQ
jgi:endo-1,4-beta-D-glucanase Y